MAKESKEDRIKAEIKWLKRRIEYYTKVLFELEKTVNLPISTEEESVVLDRDLIPIAMEQDEIDEIKKKL